jgi:hypothetical protein
LLGVRATSFELGAEPSVAAQHDCALAWERLLALCAEPVPESEHQRQHISHHII